MNEKVVVATLWMIVACMVIGWMAGEVTLALNAQDWSQSSPAPAKVSHHRHTCYGRNAGAWCP